MCGEQSRKRSYKMRVNRSKKRLKLRKTAESLGTTFPYTNLRQLIEWLTEKETEYISKGFTNLELHQEASWDEPYEMIILGTQDETDREFATRMREVEKEKRCEQEEKQKHVQFIESEAKRLGLLQ